MKPITHVIEAYDPWQQRTFRLDVSDAAADRIAHTLCLLRAEGFTGVRLLTLDA